MPPTVSINMWLLPEPLFLLLCVSASLRLAFLSLHKRKLIRLEQYLGVLLPF